MALTPNLGLKTIDRAQEGSTKLVTEWIDEINDSEQSNTTIIDKAVGNLQESLSATNETVTLVKEDLITVNDQVNTIKENLSDTNTTISNIQESLSDANKSIGDLQENLASIDESIDNLTDNLSKKAPIESPQFTGIPTAPTPDVEGNPNQIVNLTTLKTAIDSIPVPDVSGQIEDHNTSETAHDDIRTKLDQKAPMDHQHTSEDVGAEPLGSVQEAYENLAGMINDLEEKFNASLSSDTTTIYVDLNSKFDLEDGTLQRPYKTLQKALESINSDTVIIISSGIYKGDINYTLNHNLKLQGSEQQQLSPTFIDDKFSISQNSTYLEFSNINFKGIFDLTKENADADTYFNKCTFSSSEDNLSTFNPNCKTIFSQCDFKDDFGMSAVSPILFNNCDFTESGSLEVSSQEMASPALSIYLNSCKNAVITHSTGNIYVAGNTSFKQSDKGYALASTATGKDNVLYLLSGSTLQKDGTFASIQQTNSGGYYAIGSFIYSPTDTFNGVRLPIGIQSKDIIDKNDYQNISPVGQEDNTYYLKDTLTAIDNKFTTVTTDISEIQTSISTIDKLTDTYSFTVSITSANWSGTAAPFSYTIQLPSGMKSFTDDSVVFLSANQTNSKDQLEAIAKAIIKPISSTNSSIVLNALGEKPGTTINIMVTYTLK